MVRLPLNQGKRAHEEAARGCAASLAFIQSEYRHIAVGVDKLKLAMDTTNRIRSRNAF